MIILNEISQRKINIICYHLNVEAEKKYANDLIYITEIQSYKNKLVVTKGESKGRGKLGVWD